MCYTLVDPELAAEVRPGEVLYLGDQSNGFRLK